MPLNTEERRILLALAEVITPPGEILRAPQEGLAGEVEAVLEAIAPGPSQGYGYALRALDWMGVALCGGRLSEVSAEARQKALSALTSVSAGEWALRLVGAPIKAARSRDAALRAALRIGKAPPRGAPEAGRWRAQMQDARDLPQREVLDVDVVVVGSGAGGGAAAHRLASQGLAVLVLEEGAYFGRADFDPDPLKAQQKLYRKGGAQLSLGNTAIPVLMGVSVGGSTTVNSGTCYRIPDQTHRRWMLDEGLHMLGPGTLDPYYERVEAMLQVEVAQASVLGGCARVIARGAEALGFEHGPLLRNAPGCDGSGVCCFGCPTGAKRSTDVSYIPAALSKGAMLIHHACVTGILMDGDRAVGVECGVVSDGAPTGRAFSVRAKAVVLGCGTLSTPALLLRERLANRSGRVGYGLTLHPASQAWGLFDEQIRGWEGIPQSYAVETFAQDGLRFEGTFLPIDVTASFFPRWGLPWTRFAEQFDRIACFGFMIADTGRGRVVLGPGKEPQMLYWLHHQDRLRIIAGQAILAKIYFAAGAKEVYPGVQWDTFKGVADVDRFIAEAPRSLHAWNLDISAFHPLGTCRMGVNPLTSVVGPQHETHDVKHLFICDGSAVPGPLGVNPQTTIMAFAERAAAFVERRVEQSASATQHPVNTARSVEFFEGMAGELTLQGGPSVPVHFEVRATWPMRWREAWKARCFQLKLSGRMHIPGVVAPDTPCEGRLEIHPLRGDNALVYDLTFPTDAGPQARLYGAKNVGILKPFMGMTTLYADLTRLDDGAPLGSGTLLFDPTELLTWLGTWRVTSRPG